MVQNEDDEMVRYNMISKMCNVTQQLLHCIIINMYVSKWEITLIIGHHLQDSKHTLSCSKKL